MPEFSFALYRPLGDMCVYGPAAGGLREPASACRGGAGGQDWPGLSQAWGPHQVWLKDWDARLAGEKTPGTTG